MQKKKAMVPQCSVDYGFQRIGGKHKGRIIWHLSYGIQRYGQLRKAVTGITPKMLTQTLRELEDDGLIVRHEYIELPPRVEYELTDSGRELLPFIKLLSDWAAKEMERLHIPAMEVEKHEPCIAIGARVKPQVTPALQA
ncbi:MAG TPA: helix-turn-helix domain-containing protein [Ohtaekwangia sp.]|uniref:winged helix-turn-helix transcriptional regulator n=1 Tax=Ohtaekwangia sp. TaxID=2066019 RepID=UPI002F949766